MWSALVCNDYYNFETVKTQKNDSSSSVSAVNVKQIFCQDIQKVKPRKFILKLIQNTDGATCS